MQLIKAIKKKLTNKKNAKALEDEELSELEIKILSLCKKLNNHIQANGCSPTLKTKSTKLLSDEK